MLIDVNLVRESIARFKRSRFDPETLSKKLGEGDRSKRASQTQRQTRLRALMDEAEDPIAAGAALERIIRGNDLTGVNYLSIGAWRGESVCRIHLRDGSGSTVGFGTGFLVGPGVLMTNNHVIASADKAQNSLAEFDYEYDAAGKDRPVATFALLTEPAPVTSQPLDFCLVAVAPRSTDGARSLEDFGWLTLNPTPGKAIVGEYLTIIQHPGGERKQVCVRENKLLKYDEGGSTLWYMTDTVAGSSGSPVFNGTWDVVALHHSGVPETDAQGHWLTVDGKPWDPSMGEDRVDWKANEGIRISSIVEYLRQRANAELLAQPLLNPKPAPTPRTIESQGARDGSPQLVGNELRLTIPIRVAVRVGAGEADAGGGISQAHPRLVPTPATRVLAPTGVESVSVDQSNYAQRTGYQEDFLGEDAVVPLPKVVRGKSQVLTQGTKANGELRYWTYSVVMNKARRLAFFSAVNVDADKRPSDAGRDGDRWFTDTRIDAKFQLGAEFYGQQREFEADRSANPFDRGHLTRRLDAQWGGTPSTAKRNGDDSFHWTNCSPQFYRFNQGAKKWLGLEDYVIDGFAKDAGRRACVINGPVFDAPLSSIDSSGRPVPKLTGASHKDPTFGGVAIPKLFFKIVACVRPEGGLAVAAFLMSQEDLLATIDRIKGMPTLPEERLTNAEAKVYQVPLEGLGNLVGLDFGTLAEHDTGVEEAAVVATPRRIEDLTDMRL